MTETLTEEGCPKCGSNAVDMSLFPNEDGECTFRCSEGHEWKEIPNHWKEYEDKLTA